jgi:hypothetical protein
MTVSTDLIQPPPSNFTEPTVRWGFPRFLSIERFSIVPLQFGYMCHRTDAVHLIPVLNHDIRRDIAYRGRHRRHRHRADHHSAEPESTSKTQVVEQRKRSYSAGLYNYTKLKWDDFRQDVE